jgi:6-pyruvoyltetrahydropterin/6-carboxytetrahydropterin synthase
MRICKTFTFDAAHRLDRLPATHKCHNMHGHTYRVDIFISGHLDELGWIVDYADIAKAWQPLHDLLDHCVLNQVNGLDVPTTEVLAQWIYGKLERVLVGPTRRDAPWEGPQYWLSSVRVHESSTTYCEFP